MVIRLIWRADVPTYCALEHRLASKVKVFSVRQIFHTHSSKYKLFTGSDIEFQNPLFKNIFTVQNDSRLEKNKASETIFIGLK